MDDLIEKMARAITRASCTGPKAHLDEQEEFWRGNEHLARASLHAISASGEWAVVPCTPTQAMMDAAYNNGAEHSYGIAETVWYDMLQARPKV